MIIHPASKPSKTIKQFVVFVKQNEGAIIPDKALHALAKDAVRAGVFAGKNEEIFPVFAEDKVAYLVGVGKKPADLNARKIGLLVKTVLKRLPLTPAKPVYLIPHEDKEACLTAIVDGAKLGLYKWDKYLTKEDDYLDYGDYEIYIQTEKPKIIELTAHIGDGVNMARDLGNENADVADSVLIESLVRDIVENNDRCKMRVINQHEMEELGLNLHLAVNQGSNKEPKLLIISYNGGKPREPYTALIGKGLTFDSGGMNLKPTGSMEDMRMDMCGAAAVIGTLHNTLHLHIPLNLYFVIGLAENAIGPKAFKPGDVIRSYSGKTVEILNTDAEGRLVLADANSFMAKNYKPKTIINIATLTGAVIFALGHDFTGLMSTDDALAASLLEAAQSTDDRAWQLPIYTELGEHVKSEIADIKNTGLPRQAGTLSAGEFLRQFAQCESGRIKWAHLDIAGTAILDKDTGYMQAGASGAGVRLFTRFLQNESKGKRTR
jgi:leucyl aminopeptidase